MKKLRVVLTLIALMLIATTMMQAAKTLQNVITNDHNTNTGKNTATVFKFNGKTGALKQTAVLKTGGTDLGGAFVGVHDVEVTPNQACIYVLDSGSNDIAAFTGPKGKYLKVGNYTSSNALWALNGGALVSSIDSKTLYSANSESVNISAWTINSDCSLTHLNDYTPSGGADVFGTGLAVGPNGKYLLVGSIDYGYVETFTINSDGSLTDQGPYYFNTFSQCSAGCYPAGVVITSDGAALAVGNSSVAQNIMFGADVDSTGKITNQTVVELTSSPQLYNPEVPIVSPSRAGSAQGYMSMLGYGPSYPGGITVFALNEKNLGKSKVLSAKQNTESKYGYYGDIAGMGTWVIQVDYPNVLCAFPIKGTKLGKQVNTTDSHGFALSITVF